MSNFWELSDKSLPTGTLEASRVGSFKLIPDGTTAIALIKDFIFDEQVPVYRLTWQITDGEFKNRLVFQKIKCFDQKESIRDRELNMLKRIYDLTNHKPTHKDAPTTLDLMPMKGKVLGIKIGEWSMIKEDGTLAEGNNVQEVHRVDATFKVETGVRTESHNVPSAGARNSRVPEVPDDGSDIPF